MKEEKRRIVTLLNAPEAWHLKEGRVLSFGHVTFFLSYAFLFESQQQQQQPRWQKGKKLDSWRRNNSKKGRTSTRKPE